MTKTFIGTFGVGHKTHDKVFQPIVATDYDQAHSFMTDKHGNQWCAIYTLDEYKQAQAQGHFKCHKPLPFIGIDGGVLL